MLKFQIPLLFTHFWQAIPAHISSCLGQNAVVTLIGVCDAILYRTILKAVLPSPIQVLPSLVLGPFGLKLYLIGDNFYEDQNDF